MACDPLPALAVEFWKLAQAFERQSNLLDEARRAGSLAQLRFARRRLDALTAQVALKLIAFDGERWSAALPASAVNGDDMNPDVDHAVDVTLEPAVIGADGRVVLAGKVLLKEA